MKARDVIHLAKEKGARIVDLRFVDLPGLWQHFSIPVDELTEDLFAEGIGFDGSSIRGFQTIDESDMLLFPDPATAQMDPFTKVPTLVLICDVKDPVTGKDYSRDPRYVARKAEAYLKGTGIADTVYIGPELEFFFLDSVRFDQTYNCGFYYVDSEAGFWNAGRDGGSEKPNLGYKPRYKQGYFPVPPMDQFQDIRSEMVLALESVGVKVEVHHHEVVPGYEAPINLAYSQRNRSAAVRIPMYSSAEKAKRIEFRTPDPTCNPYLSFSACLMAGLDGIANKIDPGKPMDKDLYELPPEEAKDIKQLPGSLDVVLDALEQDHAFLRKGDVFTQDLIDSWIDYKRKNEVDAIRLRPHPWEFALYFDA